ncbi:MAG: N-acetylmuramoyl-L-alanine amidase [Chitinophagales bacterium]
MFKTPKIRIAFLIFLLSVHTFVYPTSKSTGNYKIKTIVLDAGHGGHDTGCNGPSGSYEKTVTLKVILALGKLIEEKYPDIKVLYSRKTDEFITLQDRALLANKNNADLFLSVHCNANPNKSAYGTETYLMGLHVSQANLDVAKRENAVIKLEDNYEKNYDGFDPDSPESMIALSLAQNANIEQSSLLAAKVQNQLTNTLKRYNRGVKQAGFWVLYRTTCPSILIETGFLTNSAEEKYLTSSEGQDELATSIFHAFEDYKNTIEKGTSSINPPTIINEDSDPSTTNNSNSSTPVKNNISSKNKNNDDADNDETADNNSKPVKGIIYKVQIKADNKIPPKSDKSYKLFKDLKFEKVKSVVKYVCGPYNTYSSALKTVKKAKSSGFKDAFVVVYKNGNRLSFDEAKKYFK